MFISNQHNTPAPESTVYLSAWLLTQTGYDEALGEVAENEEKEAFVQLMEINIVGNIFGGL